MAEIPPRDPRKGDDRPVAPEPGPRSVPPGPEIQPGQTQPTEAPTPDTPDELPPPA
jgi:hypothetical protein